MVTAQLASVFSLSLYNFSKCSSRAVWAIGKFGKTAAQNKHRNPQHRPFLDCTRNYGEEIATTALSFMVAMKPSNRNCFP